MVATLLEMHLWQRIGRRAVALTGGEERAKIIVVLAGVLGLEGADVGAVGSMAQPLQQALSIDKAHVGLLLTGSLGMGAIATLPFGALVDRVNRTRLLSWMILGWAAAMILSGTATSYLYLLCTRIVLGGFTACSAPAVASLIGDYFSPDERARVYGYVISGELFGTALGFVLSGELASWTWRAGFIVLAVPAVILVWAIHRMHEPTRGGAGQRRGSVKHARAENQKLFELLHQQHIKPRERLLLDEDPRTRSLAWSIKYVLKIPTNVVLIVASALAYMYFAGIRTFGLEYVHFRYGISHGWSVALLVVLGSGAIAGVLVSGRIADRFIQRGHLRARVSVAAISYWLALALLLPSLLCGSALVAVVFFTLASAAIGAIFPPIDGARLDIMLPGLWGRAESVRVVLRKVAEAGAPFAFGFLAEHVFGGRAGKAQGLHSTFLLMLVVFVLAGLVALIGWRTYPRDVATADENNRRARQP